VTNMDNMFLNATLSTANYDALLMGWDAQPLQVGVNFHGGNSTYCLGEAARTNMIDNDGWIITDAGFAGLDCGLIFTNGFEDAFITSFQASEKQFEHDFSKITDKLDTQPLLIARGLDNTGTAVIQFYLRNDLGQLQIRMDDFDSIQNDWITGQWQSIDNNKITTISW